MKGPWKKFGYEANKWKHLGMIAGGTGLAPMYQLILESLNTADDDTKITLLYANKSGADILLKERLDKLAAQHPSRFNVVYSLDTPPPGWKGEKGFVTADMVKEHMPAPVDGTRIFVCGAYARLLVCSSARLHRCVLDWTPPSLLPHASCFPRVVLCRHGCHAAAHQHTQSRLL